MLSPRDTLWAQHVFTDELAPSFESPCGKGERLHPRITFMFIFCAHPTALTVANPCLHMLIFFQLKFRELGLGLSTELWNL